MQQLGEHHGTDTVAQHLNRLTTATSWQEATGSALVGRLPAGGRGGSGGGGGAGAGGGRGHPGPGGGRCAGRGGQGGEGGVDEAEAAVPAHRQQAAPVRGAGRRR
ncbi:hypothetical protein [Streptomyces yangpuensis]